MSPHRRSVSYTHLRVVPGSDSDNGKGIVGRCGEVLCFLLLQRDRQPAGSIFPEFFHHIRTDFLHQSKEVIGVQILKGANRGACRQLCRRKYTVTDKETGAQLDIDGRYVLSPKDLCTCLLYTSVKTLRGLSEFFRGYKDKIKN